MGKYTVKRTIFGAKRIAFDCEICGHRLSAEVSDAGRRDVCPECNGPIMVPGDDLKIAEQSEAEQDLARLQAEQKAAVRSAEQRLAQANSQRALRTSAQQHASWIAVNQCIVALHIVGAICAIAGVSSLVEYRIVVAVPVMGIGFLLIGAGQVLRVLKRITERLEDSCGER